MPNEVQGPLPSVPPEWVALADLPMWVSLVYGVTGDAVTQEIILGVRRRAELKHRVATIKPIPSLSRASLPLGLRCGATNPACVCVSDWEQACADWQAGTVGGWGTGSDRKRLPIEVLWSSIELFVEIRAPRWKKQALVAPTISANSDGSKISPRASPAIRDRLAELRGEILVPRGYADFRDVSDRARKARFGNDAEPPLTAMELALLTSNPPWTSSPDLAISVIPGKLSFYDDLELSRNPAVRKEYEDTQARAWRLNVQDKDAAQWLARHGALFEWNDGREIVLLDRMPDASPQHPVMNGVKQRFPAVTTKSSSAESDAVTNATAAAHDRNFATRKLPLWLTPMQALAWVCTRNIGAVWRADLESEYQPGMGLDETMIEEWFPRGRGITTLSLDLWHGMLGGTTDWLVPSEQGIETLVDSLRAGDLESNGISRDGERISINASGWRRMTLTDGQNYDLVPSRAHPYCGLIDAWRDILISRDKLFSLWRAPSAPELINRDSDALPVATGPQVGDATVATLPPKRRGPKSGLTDRIAMQMVEDIRQGKRTLAGLNEAKQEALSVEYGASRDTVTKALRHAAEIVGVSDRN